MYIHIYTYIYMCVCVHVYKHNTQIKADAMENILQLMISFVGLAWGLGKRKNR